MAVDVPIYTLLIVYLLLLVPIIIFKITKTELIKDLLVAVVRMTIQLLLLGVYLEIIFKINQPILSLLWFIIMTFTASFVISDRAGLKVKYFLAPVFAGIFTGTILSLLSYLVFIIKPEPFFDSRYLIPLGGMLLGNILRGNILTLERFYSEIIHNYEEWQSYIFMGASANEAAMPFLRKAFKASLTPHLASMLTIGIVSLPGMMTGQIIGGSFPIVAIKYQLIIMIGIFTSLSVSSIINVILSLKVSLNKFSMLRFECFKETILSR